MFWQQVFVMKTFCFWFRFCCENRLLLWKHFVIKKFFVMKAAFCWENVRKLLWEGKCYGNRFLLLKTGFIIKNEFCFGFRSRNSRRWILTGWRTTPDCRRRRNSRYLGHRTTISQKVLMTFLWLFMTFKWRFIDVLMIFKWHFNDVLKSRRKITVKNSQGLFIGKNGGKNSWNDTKIFRKLKSKLKLF